MDLNNFVNKIIETTKNLLKEFDSEGTEWYESEYPSEQRTNPYYALSCLFGEIEDLFIKGVDKDAINRFYAAEYKKYTKAERDYIKNTSISIDRTYRSAEIRKNWDKALESVKSGTALSGPIDFAFGKRDISELAKLHKVGKHRQKIEDLLGDCNFHTECGDFGSGIYDKYIITE